MREAVAAARMRTLVGAFAVCAALAVAGCGGDSPSSGTASPTQPTKDGPPAKPPGPITTQSGVQAAKRPEPVVPAPEDPPPEELIVENLINGSGKTAQKGDELDVHFTSIRYNGEFFESIWDKPFDFELSKKDVNPGWVQGLPGMRVGGRRELIVPTPLTSNFPISAADSDPENALVYVVDLLGVH
jgi:peptidylprolyl isomerase